jgi:hypothetical protein
MLTDRDVQGNAESCEEDFKKSGVWIVLVWCYCYKLTT